MTLHKDIIYKHLKNRCKECVQSSERTLWSRLCVQAGRVSGIAWLPAPPHMEAGGVGAFLQHSKQRAGLPHASLTTHPCHPSFR